jgi:hypothetical protein
MGIQVIVKKGLTQDWAWAFTVQKSLGENIPLLFKCIDFSRRILADIVRAMN